MIRNNPEDDKTLYTAEDIAQLEDIHATLSEIYTQAVFHYNDNTRREAEMSHAARAAQRTAIATSATALMEATDRLRKAKPNP